jgi:DNA modification methylase
MSAIRQDKRNYRIHSEKNKRIIKKSLDELGAGRSILIDSDNEIIAGNGVNEQWGNRPIKIIETDGTELIAIKRTDLKTGDDKRKQLALIDNHSSDTSEFEVDLIKEDFSNDFLNDWKFDLPEEIKEIKEDDFIPNENIQTDIKYSDLYQIGNHYLLCGDAIKKEDYEKLLQGKKSDLIFTDPPYDLEDSYSQHIFDSAKEDSHIFIMNSDRLLIENVNNGFQWFRKFFSVDFRQARLVSNNQPMTRVDLIAEFCKGKTKFNNLHDGFSTLIECAKIHNDNEKINFGHKQAKKIDLPSTFIQHYSNENELVCDFFGGSGSTMAACEQLNRNCFMMELEPKNCQMILDRMKKCYNLEASKL